MKKNRTRIIASIMIVIVVAILWAPHRVKFERGLSATSAAIASDVDVLAWAVSRAAPIDVSTTGDLSYSHLFSQTLGDRYDPKFTPSIQSNFVSGDGRIRFEYWLPHDREKSIVFVTDPAIRRGFSLDYFHWIVTVEGKIKTISDSEFESLKQRIRRN